MKWTQTKYFATKCKHWREQNPTHNLITLGGVHGPEPKRLQNLQSMHQSVLQLRQGNTPPEDSSKNLKRKFTSP